MFPSVSPDLPPDFSLPDLSLPVGVEDPPESRDSPAEAEPPVLPEPPVSPNEVDPDPVEASPTVSRSRVFSFCRSVISAIDDSSTPFLSVCAQPVRARSSSYSLLIRSRLRRSIFLWYSFRAVRRSKPPPLATSPSSTVSEPSDEPARVLECEELLSSRDSPAGGELLDPDPPLKRFDEELDDGAMERPALAHTPRSARERTPEPCTHVGRN